MRRIWLWLRATVSVRRGSRRGLFASGLVLVVAGFGVLVSSSSGSTSVTGLAPRSAQLDALSGAQAAAASGIDIASLRTANTRTWRGAGGLMTTRTYEGPVNYKDANGAWQPISNTLVPDPNAGSGAVQNQANSYSVTMPGTIGGAFKVANSGVSVGFSVKGAATVPAATSGNQAAYKNAFASTDLLYSAGNDLVKEQIVLADATAPTSFTFRLSLSAGLTPKQDPAGGVEFYDASGQRQSIAIAPPNVQDATGIQPDAFKYTSTDLTQTANGAWELTVKVDPKWLADPGRQFPVTVDPTVTITSGQADCWMASWAPTSNLCGVGYMDIGQSGSSLAHATLAFPLTSIPRDALVTEADLGVDFPAGTAISGVQARGLTRLATGAYTWNTYDGVHNWITPGGDASSTISDSEPVGAAAGFATWYITDLAQGWINNPNSNYGVLLKADTAGALRGAYNTQGTSNQSLWPYLQVTWTPRVASQPAAPMVKIPMTASTGLQVNAANGDVELTTPGMSINGTGLDFDLGARYSNLAPSFTYAGGQSGLGFVFNPGPAAEILFSRTGTSTGWAYAAWVFCPDGQVRLFTPQPDGTYRTPGLDATLTYTGTVWALAMNQDQTTYNFNPNGTLASEQDRNGNAISYTWGTYGSSPQLSSITDTQGRTITPTYTGSYVTKWTDSTGRSISYGLNASSQVTSLTDPAGNITQYGYDGSANLNKVTDPNGNVTNLLYDTSKRVTTITRVTNPSTGTGPQYTFSYSSTTTGCPATPNDPTSVFAKNVATDADNAATTYCADVNDRTAAAIDPASNSTTNGYQNGNLDDPTSSVAKDSGGTTVSTDTTQYSALGSVPTSDPTTDTITGSGTTLSTGTASYPSSGANDHLPSTTTDPQGNAANYTYDSYGNPTTITDALSATGPYQNTSQDQITLTYSATHPGWLTQSTDPNGHATSYGYDSHGNQTSVTPPSPLGAESFGYDALSRQTSAIDGNLKTTATTYDSDDRVTKLSYDDGSTVTNTYDANGNLTKVVHPSGTKTNTYDALDQLTQTSLPGGATINYSYDANGNLASLTDAGGTVSYTYNNLNQLTKVTEPGGYNTSFTYDALGNRTGITYPNGVMLTYVYNAANQPLTLAATAPGGATISSITYTYGSGSSKSVIQTATDQAGTVTTYTYDPLNRLIEAKTATSGGSTTADYTYSYDGAGNRLTETVNGTTTNYTYNGANELTAVGPASLSYDTDGQETNNGSNSLTYNVKQQTTAIGSVAMGFFGAGQTEQTVSAGATLQNSSIGIDAIGSSGSTAYITRDSAGEALGERASGGRYYYIVDPRGTILAVTDSSGNTVRNTSYDPYGAIITATGTGPHDLGYLGTYTGQPTGLLHFGARLADPTLGRWTQRDPVQASLVMDPTQANPYVYAGDDPVNATDGDGTTYCIPPEQNTANGCRVPVYVTKKALQSIWNRNKNRTIVHQSCSSVDKLMHRHGCTFHSIGFGALLGWAKGRAQSCAGGASDGASPEEKIAGCLYSILFD